MANEGIEWLGLVSTPFEQVDLATVDGVVVAQPPRDSPR